MAIGTTAAILGSAVIGAAGSALAGGSTKKAAKNAAEAAKENTASNNALTLDIYNRNTGNIGPWMRSGLRANSAFDELLYGAPPPTAVPSAFGPMGAAGFGVPQPYAFGSYGGYERDSEPLAMGGVFGNRRIGAPAGDFAYSNMQYGAPVYAMDQPPAGAVTAPAPSARSAFDNYLHSTGYQFRFDEGMKGLNIGAGARGMLESGARDKAAIRYGQGIASDEFAKYMALLDNQQRLGFGGASALAGVGQNMVGNITANNNNAASAAANAALVAGNANASMWTGIGNSVGTALGQLGSSYNKKIFV
jgi:hypothetical protein